MNELKRAWNLVLVQLPCAKAVLVWIIGATVAVVAVSGCAEKRIPQAISGKTVAPGIYSSPPLGIHSVNGECVGKVALTPALPHRHFEFQPYPLVYDCASKTFEVLNRPSDLLFIADLTLIDSGYYLHQSQIKNGQWQGGYHFYDRSGKETHRLPRPDSPKVHDLILTSQDITYLHYFNDWDSASCGQGALREFDIVTESLEGKILWKWTSKGQFGASEQVNPASADSAKGGIRSFVKTMRNCYTSIARRLARFEPPKWLLGSKLALLDLEVEDYIQVQSLQRVGTNGDILVSAKNFDTIYLIDKTTGKLKWSMGGKYSKTSPNHPVDDPRGGFSHAHSARLWNNTLWVFDNGSVASSLPSRAVAYQLDSTPQKNRQTFEFQEPNGRHRYTLGSVEQITDNQVLIGWGAVHSEDAHSAQRGVSIVRLDDQKEIFSIDLSPGWISYRVKTSKTW